MKKEKGAALDLPPDQLDIVCGNRAVPACLFAGYQPDAGLFWKSGLYWRSSEQAVGDLSQPEHIRCAGRARHRRFHARAAAEKEDQKNRRCFSGSISAVRCC